MERKLCLLGMEVKSSEKAGLGFRSEFTGHRFSGSCTPGHRIAPGHLLRIEIETAYQVGKSTPKNGHGLRKRSPKHQAALNRALYNSS